MQELNLMGNKIATDLMSSITEKIKSNKSIAHYTSLPRERDGREFDKSSKRLIYQEPIELLDKDQVYYSQVQAQVNKI